MSTESSSCVFCAIVSGAAEAHRVFETEHTLGFLDHTPLFPGHVLVVPKAHHETLAELPAELVEPLFADAKKMSAIVVAELGAQGSFVAMNNTVSQSVPHLHVHVVPRSRKDGLRGFFWPRNPYDDDAHMGATATRLATAWDA